MARFELASSCLTGRCTTSCATRHRWSARWESNPSSRSYKERALSLSYAQSRRIIGADDRSRTGSIRVAPFHAASTSHPLTCGARRRTRTSLFAFVAQSPHPEVRAQHMERGSPLVFQRPDNNWRPWLESNQQPSVLETEAAPPPHGLGLGDEGRTRLPRFTAACLIRSATPNTLEPNDTPPLQTEREWRSRRDSNSPDPDRQSGA